MQSSEPSQQGLANSGVRYRCSIACSSMPVTSCMPVQTPVKQSPLFERMLEEAMKRGDAAAFAGVCSFPCWFDIQLLSSATGGRMGGGLEVAILLTNAGKGAAVKNSPLEGKPQQGRSSRPTAEERHFQEYAYGDS